MAKVSTFNRLGLTASKVTNLMISLSTCALVQLGTFQIGTAHAAPRADTNTSSVLCYNPKTQAISVRSACQSGETTVNGKNIVSLFGNSGGGNGGGTSGFAPKSCTTLKASNRGSNFLGEVGVALSCSKGIMLSRSFETVDNSGAKPTLKGETVLKDKNNFPIGTQIVLKGKESTFYQVNLSVDCCQ